MKKKIKSPLSSKPNQKHEWVPQKHKITEEEKKSTFFPTQFSLPIIAE